MTPLPFRGCTSLITGASAGLGAEFARQLAPQADTLVLVARRGERLRSLARDLLEAHPRLRIECLPIDLAGPGATDRLAAELSTLALAPDLLINNAGLGDYGNLATADPARLDAMIATNIAALVQLTRLLLPDMLARRRGWILNVSSIASLLPLPGLATYAATKAFVTSFSEAVRLECRRDGIRLTALLPGPVDTEFSSVAQRPDSTSHCNLAPALFKIPAEQAVREGLSALAAGRPRAIPGRIPRFCMSLATRLPMPLVRPLVAHRGGV